MVRIEQVQEFSIIGLSEMQITALESVINDYLDSDHASTTGVLALDPIKSKLSEFRMEQ